MREILPVSVSCLVEFKQVSKLLVKRDGRGKDEMRGRNETLSDQKRPDIVAAVNDKCAFLFFLVRLRLGIG